MYITETFDTRDERTARKAELKKLGYRDVVQYTEPVQDMQEKKYFTVYFLAYPPPVIETEEQLAEGYAHE